MRKLFALALSLAYAITPTCAASEDFVLKAMTDELQRSTARLQLSGHPKPYFVSYCVRDSESKVVSASFGALTEFEQDHDRTLNVDVRIGDYKLDSSSGNGGSSALAILARLMQQGQQHKLPTDNDYTALRRELWLQTDAAYKTAIEGLETKESYLKQNTVEDRPDSLSQEKPVTLLQPTQHLDFDMVKWAGNMRKLSAVFKNYPKIRGSKASIGAGLENRWFVNNEGFKHRVGETGLALTVMAETQCPDGMRISDQDVFAGYKESELPNQEEVQNAAKKLADTLDKLSVAPIVDDYRGPIIFEGQAAAEFFHQLVDPRVVASSSQLRSPGGEKLGIRLLPKFIDVVDDPKAKEYKGQILYGTYEVDDEGVEGQKITLVDKGILKTLCIGRTPTRTIKQSNGHARNGSATTSNLFILSDKQMPMDELKAKLIEYGKEDGLKEVYIARKLVTVPSDFDFATMRALLRSTGGMLLPPVLLYKVSTEDGHEELVRGGSFSNLSMRVLRDIDATGNDSKAYPARRSSEIASIIAPSVLVKEIEIQKPERTNSKAPVLQNPFFEK